MKRALRSSTLPVGGRECGCLLHDVNSTSNLFTVTETLKRRAAYKKLLTKGLINKRRKFLCQSCLDREVDFDEPVPTASEVDSPNAELEHSDASNDGGECKDWLAMSDHEKESNCKQAYQLGVKIRKALYEDCISAIGQYEDFDGSPKDWLAQQNKLLVSFLMGCTGCDNPEGKKELALTHAVEAILHTRHLNTVTPFAFLRNVLLDSCTKNKTCIQVNGVWEPAGSYTTVHNFACREVPKVDIPQGDIHVVIDNNQVVPKTSGRRVKEDGAFTVDICTAMSVIKPASDEALCCDSSLKPSSWWQRPSQQTMQKVVNLEAEALDEYRVYRHKYISEKIQQIRHTFNKDKTDYVDVAVRHENNKNVCSQCTTVYTSNDNLCPSCKFDPVHFDKGYDPYHLCDSFHATERPKVITAEPCLVNPNSKENVKKALQHVENEVLTGDRKWTTLWADGVPLRYGFQMQETMLKCSQCEEICNLSDNHEHKDHLEPLFGSLLLRLGKGHVELNMARTLLDYLWQPIGSDVAKHLGFRSMRALEVVKKGIDHHRSLQILQIILEGLVLELLTPYIAELPGSVEASPTNYFRWVAAEVKSQNYLFFFDLAFSYLFSFHLYHCGVRKNDFTAISAAEAAFVPLFAGRPHDIYKRLMLRERHLQVTMPPKLLEYCARTSSFSVSGDALTGQGADFIQEQQNRIQKSFLPPGRITGDIWRKTARTADDLQRRKESLVLLSGFSATDGMRTYPKFDLEVTMVRRLIRGSGLFKDHGNDQPIRSVGGVLLPQGLLNMKHQVQQCHKLFQEEVARSGDFNVRHKAEYVCLSLEEAEARQQNLLKTKDDVIAAIRATLGQMQEKSDYEEQLDTLVKHRGRHQLQEFIRLYENVSEQLSVQLLQVEELPELHTMDD